MTAAAPTALEPPSGWCEHVSTTPACRLAHPRDWRVTRLSEPQPCLVLCAGQGATVMAVACEPVADDDCFDAFARRQLDTALTGLELGRVLDVERGDMLGYPAQRLLAAHVADGIGITLNQWHVRAPWGHYVVSASTPTHRYLAERDVVDRIVATFDPRRP